MSNTATNVTVGKPKVGGSIYVGPISAQLPTDAAAEVGADFECLGYVSDDGVSNTNTPESETIRAWGGDAVLNPQTSKDDKFKFMLIEALNQGVLKLIYGESHVKGTLAAGLSVEATTDAPEAHAYVIDMVLNNNTLKRFVIPNATVTELGEIKYADESAVGYDVTVSAIPDESGITHYEYFKTAAQGDTE